MESLARLKILLQAATDSDAYPIRNPYQRQRFLGDVQQEFGIDASDCKTLEEIAGKVPPPSVSSKPSPFESPANVGRKPAS